jgi:DNA methylase
MRLTLWYCGMLGMALVLFGVVLYFGTQYFLLTPIETDAALLGSETGDLVLDPFCGSGTTFLAAQKMVAGNQVAPPEQRAALVSAFFVAAYGGVSVPVVGVGLLAQSTDLLVASICLAAVIALLLLLTLAAVLWPVRRAALKVGNR